MIIQNERRCEMEYTLKNNLRVFIREAEEEDAVKVIEYLKQVSLESSNLLREPDEVVYTEEFEREFLRKNKESKNSFVFTVWNQDTLVSVTGFHGSDLARITHKVNFGISVLKDYQGLGIGSLLLKLIELKAKEYGKTKIELDVRSDNFRAITLYENAGFYQEGVRKNGINDKGKMIDLVLMGKDLL